MVNGKQHSVWFVRTGMKGLPQNVLLNFRLEFPKSDLTIYIPSGISEIFCQMVSALAVQQLPMCYFCYSKLFHWPNNLAPFFSQSEGTPPQSMKLQEQDITLLVKRNVIGSFEPLRILIG